MGLFSRKPKEPIVHPAVERTIHVEVDRAAVPPHLDGYWEIMGRRARELEVGIASSRSWVRLTLPRAGVHPWEAHNLAYWLLELGTVVVVVGPSPDRPGYHLLRADDPNDLLEGWTDDGEPVTVHVPGNDVVRPDPEVAGIARSAAAALRDVGVPHDGWADHGTILVFSEDPGHDLNPAMAATRRSRAALRPVYLDGV
jgi:hypothetical protein